MTRAEAWDIVCEFVSSDGLRRHMLAVEACMVAYAEHYGEDSQIWSITGLLHDFDWEIHPSVPDHPVAGEKILQARGVDEEVRKAILSHAAESGVKRDTRLEKALFACDELSGFLTACAYVKPSRRIADVDLVSVKKKLKDKSFARAISRDEIAESAAAFGVSLDLHIKFCLLAMARQAEQLGLAGMH